MQSTAPLIYPSLLAQHTLDTLLHPPTSFISSAPAGPIPSRSPWLQQQLPCDIFLLNLRATFQSSSESALILHRRGFDCGFDMNPLSCTLNNGTVSQLDIPMPGFFMSMFSSCQVFILWQCSIGGNQLTFDVIARPMIYDDYLSAVLELPF